MTVDHLFRLSPLVLCPSAAAKVVGLEKSRPRPTQDAHIRVIVWIKISLYASEVVLTKSAETNRYLMTGTHTVSIEKSPSLAAESRAVLVTIPK